MNICIISKYPPIEGGVSSHTYWMARELGKRGHKVYVVTNSWEVEGEYRETINREDMHLFEPKNVQVFSTSKEFWSPKGTSISPILKSDYYTEKLISLALNVADKCKIDIIYSHYLLPYGVVAFVVKQITGIPFILRHAGSDMGKLFFSRSLQSLFIKVIESADKFICSRGNQIMLRKKNVNFREASLKYNFSINTDFFNPNIPPYDLTSFMKDKNAPILSYFGKVSELKKTYAFLKAASELKNKKFYILLVVGGGSQLVEVKKFVKSLNLSDKVIYLPFQAPWKIPSIMKASYCVVNPESFENGIFPKGTHYPKIANEAMACGKCVLIGRGVAIKGSYKHLIHGKDYININPDSIDDSKEILTFVIDNPSEVEQIGKNAAAMARKINNFPGYIDSIELLFKSVLG